MPTLRIEAADTLFFRDGKPFTMGEDTQAAGIEIPPPSVLHGAMRTAFIANKLNEDSLLTPLIDSSNGISIKGFYLNHKTEYEIDSYFPMPRDLVVPQKKTKNDVWKAVPLDRKDTPQYASSKTEEILCFDSNRKIEEESFLLEQLEFQSYLNATSNVFYPKLISDFFATEPKIGIGRSNSTNISDNGLLYRSVQKRPKKISFLIDIEGAINVESKKGYLQLGGEKKIAFWEEVEPIAIDCPLIDSTCFKIYLSTPAFFEDGWKPTDLLKKHGLKLLTASIGRPLQIGGWDVEVKKPKPMWQAVPAGSVYYVEASSKEKASELAQLIHGQSISENIDLKFNLKQQGFGIAYIGRI